MKKIINKNLKKQVKIVRLNLEAENNFYERQMKANKNKKIAKEVKAIREMIQKKLIDKSVILPKNVEQKKFLEQWTQRKETAERFFNLGQATKIGERKGEVKERTLK